MNYDFMRLSKSKAPHYIVDQQTDGPHAALNSSWRRAAFSWVYCNLAHICASDSWMDESWANFSESRVGIRVRKHSVHYRLTKAVTQLRKLQRRQRCISTS